MQITRTGSAFLALLMGLAPLTSLAGLGPLLGKPKQISEEDWKNAKDKSTGDKDLRLADGGHYIGGIDRIWWLVVTGPPTNKFHYYFAMLPGAGTEMHGTYEVKEGLAWFNGTKGKGSGPDGQIDKKEG